MKKLSILLLAIVMIASLAAAPALAVGGGGNGDGSGGGGGKSPLNVASVSVNGTPLADIKELPATGSIDISFTRGMDEHQQSTMAAIQIRNADSTVTFDGNRTFTVSYRNLAPGTHTLIVGTGAQANNDNFLEEEYTQDFIVAGPDHDCPSIRYTDVNPDSSHWTHKPIDYVLEHQYMTGLSDTTFNPNGTITRAMAVQVLYAMDGKPTPGASAGFADVETGRWYTKAVNWAANNQIVSGYSKTSFRPNDAVTRQQLITIFYRYAQYKRYDSAANGIITDYADASSLTSYAVVPMKWAIGHHVLSGNRVNDQVLLDPFGSASRAQLAAILKAFDENVKTS